MSWCVWMQLLSHGMVHTCRSSVCLLSQALHNDILLRVQPRWPGWSGYSWECLTGRHACASAESSLRHKLVSSVGYSGGGWRPKEGGSHYWPEIDPLSRTQDSWLLVQWSAHHTEVPLKGDSHAQTHMGTLKGISKTECIRDMPKWGRRNCGTQWSLDPSGARHLLGCGYPGMQCLCLSG